MPAILFGSISTLADTSELQRAAFNEAFAEHGLDLRWERAEYQELLTGNGGEQRIADAAHERDLEVDASAVHATKSSRFQEMVTAVGQRARPGVVETIRAARQSGWRVALVTTTSRENVEAVLTALEPELSRDDFDLVLDRRAVENPKPDPEIYAVALDELSEDAAACVAIEDNVGGAEAAEGAGITCVAFANQNTTAHDFGDTPRTAHLDFDELSRSVAVR